MVKKIDKKLLSQHYSNLKITKAFISDKNNKIYSINVNQYIYKIIR
jgi:hypothetical protein